MIKTFINPIILTPLIFNLLLILLIINFSKINKFHPISFIIILILVTFLISLKINFIIKSWFPIILFLIIIGGLIVIFIYITRLTNNELFFFNFKLILINIIKISPLIILIIIIYIYINEQIYTNIDLFNRSNLKFSYWDQNNINIIYKIFYNKSTIFIMLYLYYSIICIINICSNFKLPLRQLSF